MDTGLTVVVVLVVLAMVAAATLLVRHGRQYRQEQRRLESALADRPTHTDDPQFGTDRPVDGWHGPSCSGGFPAVPEQRSGDHDRQEPARARPSRHLWRRRPAEPG
jgi:hypothetical protein